MQKIKGSLKKFGSSTFSSLRIYNFRLYFIGQAVSVSGIFMQTIAQSWLVLKLSGSGTALGLVTAFQFFPVLLFGSYAGVLADRFVKRELLYLTQAAFAIQALVLAILVATNIIQLWMVCALSAVYGFILAIDSPTRQTFVNEMAGSAELKNAVTLFQMEANLTRVIGPALAGIIIANIGIAPCFFINAASYLAVLACILLMRNDELHIIPTVKRAKGQLREGLNYVKRTPVLRTILIMMAIIGTLTYEFSISLPMMTKFTFHGNANHYAWLTCAMGAGSVIGGLIAAGRKKTGLRVLTLAAIGFGVAVLLTSISPTLPLAIFSMILVGVFSIFFTSLGNTTLQLESDPAMRSRVMSLWAVAFLGSTPIGGPIIGWIGEHTNPRLALAVGGFAALAAGIFGIISTRRFAPEKPVEDLTRPIPTDEKEKIM